MARERLRLKYKRAPGGYAVTEAQERDAGPALIVPGRHLGRPVVEIGPSAFEACGRLERVFIPPSVERVGRFAFDACGRLEEVSGAEGVRSVGEFAFAGCVSLSSFTVPRGCESIERNAFQGCGRLLEVRNLSSLKISPGDAGHGGVAEHAIEVHDGESGTGRLFTDAGGFTFRAYGDACLLTGRVGEEADVCLPPSAEGRPYSVCSCAFSGDTRLESLRIPDSVTVFGEDAFSGCTALRRVLVPSLSAWLECRFADDRANPLRCGAVLSVGGEDLYDVKIPEGTEEIPPYAFAGSPVRNVRIPPSVRVFGRGAFEGCDRLEGVYIDDLAAWCGARFDGTYSNPSECCDFLYVSGEKALELRVPEGVRTVSPRAFYGYMGVVSVTLPESLEAIGWDAFCLCRNLREVVNLSPLCLSPGGEGYGCVALYASRVRGDGNGEPFTRADAEGFLWREEDGKTLLCGYAGDGRDIALPAPGGAYALSRGAFYGLNCIESVTLPDGLESLSVDAFWECAGLRRVRLGKGLLRVDEWSFTGCALLEAVDIPEGVRSVGRYAFAFCRGLSSVTLPEGLEEIGDHAFAFTSAAGVVVPSSVRKVGDGAFHPEGESVTVYYRGGERAWKSATEDWFLYDREMIRILFYSERRPLFRRKRYWHIGADGEPVAW